MAMGFQSARLVNSALQMSKSGQTLMFADIRPRKTHTIAVYKNIFYMSKAIVIVKHK